MSATDIGGLEHDPDERPAAEVDAQLQAAAEDDVEEPARTMAAVTARATILVFHELDVGGFLKSCMVRYSTFASLPVRDRQVEDQVRDEDGGEQVGDEADDQGHGVSLDRPGPELEEEDGRDDRRQVRVEDGA